MYPMQIENNVLSSFLMMLKRYEYVAVQTATQPGNCSPPPGTYRSGAIEYCLLRLQVHMRFHVCLRLSWTSNLLAVGFMITPTTTAGFSKKGTYTHPEALIWPWVRVRKADYRPGAGEKSRLWVRVRYAFNFCFILFIPATRPRPGLEGVYVPFFQKVSPLY